jgi:type I restriction enzyme M protein
VNLPLIYRYVDTFEEEAEMEIAAAQKESNKLQDELKAVQKEMDKHLKELRN